MIKVTFSCHEKVTGQIPLFLAEKLASVLRMSTFGYITKSKYIQLMEGINQSSMCFCNIVLFFTAHPST